MTDYSKEEGMATLCASCTNKGGCDGAAYRDGQCSSYVYAGAAKSKRTPGPLEWSDTDAPCHKELHPAGYLVGEVGSVLYHGADWPVREENAAFLVGCWNGCDKAGIVNPEAVPDLVEAAEEIATWTRRDRWREEIFQLDIEALRAALAKAKGAKDVCRRCGSPIVADRCTDETCPHSDHGQEWNDTLADISGTLAKAKGGAR